MLVSIAFAVATWRRGMVLRRARLRRVRRAADARARHLRFAKPTLVLLLIGFAAGPISSVWLRDWEPLRSFHGIAGLIALGLFAATGLTGRRIERQRSRDRDIHALLGTLGLLAAGVAAIAGFILLP